MERSYFDDAAGPLHALAFVTPMVLVHELAGGSAVLAGRDLSAALTFAGIDPAGVGRLLLPGVALVILLAAHLAGGGAWRVRLTTLGGMAGESALLAVPILLLAVAVAFLPLSAGGDPGLTLALGAGVYEELLFRLIGVTGGVMLLHDVLAVPRRASLVIAVLVSAVLFALYHYRGGEDFAWASFAFRTAAGCYLGVVFGLRGFGVAAGAHAAYDAAVLWLR